MGARFPARHLGARPFTWLGADFDPNALKNKT